MIESVSKTLQESQRSHLSSRSSTYSESGAAVTDNLQPRPRCFPSSLPYSSPPSSRPPQPSLPSSAAPGPWTAATASSPPGAPQLHPSSQRKLSRQTADLWPSWWYWSPSQWCNYSLGVVVQDLNVPVGLTCDPITVRQSSCQSIRSIYTDRSLRLWIRSLVSVVLRALLRLSAATMIASVSHNSCNSSELD